MFLDSLRGNCRQHHRVLRYHRPHDVPEIQQEEPLRHILPQSHCVTYRKWTIPQAFAGDISIIQKESYIRYTNTDEKTQNFTECHDYAMTPDNFKHEKHTAEGMLIISNQINNIPTATIVTLFVACRKKVPQMCHKTPRVCNPRIKHRWRLVPHW